MFEIYIENFLKCDWVLNVLDRRSVSIDKFRAVVEVSPDSDIKRIGQKNRSKFGFVQTCVEV